MKKQQYLKSLMTIIITATVTFSVTMLWVYGGTKNQEVTSILGNAFASDKLLTKLNLIDQKIKTEYMGDEVEEDILLEGAIKGYVSALGDSYTEYISPDEMKEYFSDTVGEFVGIGVEITKDTVANEIVVYDTLPKSPAEVAGIKSGDILIAVDGVSCDGDDFDTITDSIKGKIGSKVKITVRRLDENNQEETIDFEIVRANINMIRVTSQMLDEDIGYIYISSFDGTKVAEQFEEEYDKLVTQGMKSLIIDVRTNGGGIVDEATEIADLFTGKGQTLLIEKDKSGKENTIVSNKDKKITMKTVLLVNEYSASASEILAGAIKDLADNVTLVGKTTYGKGVIQTLYELSDGSGLKITTEQYYTPNHNEINKIGVKPDVEVKDDEIFTGNLDAKNDKSLKRAMELLR